jgi:hypothetical protein
MPRSLIQRISSASTANSSALSAISAAPRRLPGRAAKPDMRRCVIAAMLRMIARTGKPTAARLGPARPLVRTSIPTKKRGDAAMDGQLTGYEATYAHGAQDPLGWWMDAARGLDWSRFPSPRLRPAGRHLRPLVPRRPPQHLPQRPRPPRAAGHGARSR